MNRSLCATNHSLFFFRVACLACAVPWIASAGDAIPSPSSAPLTLPAEVPTDPPVTSRFQSSFYGFLATEAIYDSTQSFDEIAGGGVLRTPGSYEGTHPRFALDVRRSRFGYRIQSPESHGIKASGVLEFDMRGGAPLSTEGFTFRSPLVRLRHAMMKLETPYVEITAGLWWSLFGFLPHYLPASLSFGGGPGEPLNRDLQIRLSRLFKTERAHVEVAVSLNKNPQQDAGSPQGVGGVRVLLPGWRGAHTVSNLFLRANEPASFALSGTVRKLMVPTVSMKETNTATFTSYAVAADLQLPIIPIGKERGLAHALTLSGMGTLGAGNSDLFLRGGGGVAPYSLAGKPNEDGSPTRDVYKGLDAGMVGLNAQTNLPGLIRWRSARISLEYYLPPTGNVWLSTNVEWLESPNIEKFAGVNSQPRLKNELWFDVNALANLTEAVRVGVQYAHFRQQFVASTVPETHHRGMISGFYFF